MSAELYLRDILGQWRKAREFYFHDGTEWKNITEAYYHDGSTWRQVFQYTSPSGGGSTPTGAVRPTVVASSGTYVSLYPATPNNSFDATNPVVDTASSGEWRVGGQTGNEVIWTWASGSNSYSTISLNVRLAISNLKSASTSSNTDICIDWQWDGGSDYVCVEYATQTITSPATIVFSYSLNGGSNYTDFYTYNSFNSETAAGTISSSDITSGLGSINSNLSNLKVKAAISCPTGTNSNASANLIVYDVWANTVAGLSAVPPTVTFTASASNVPNGTSVNLVSSFSGNNGADITSASISQGVGSIGTISPVTTQVIPPSSSTTTYTLTVTDSNGNSTTKQVSVTAYAAGATSPTINLGSGAGQSKSVQLGTSVNLTATWSPGNPGQSVVSVTSGIPAEAGLPSPWTPSGSPGYRTLDPTKEGNYTITNTLNGGTPSASAVLIVTAPVMASIFIQSYYPSSALAIKPASIYTDDDGSTFSSTSLKIWPNYYGGGVQGVIKAQWQSSTNNSVWSPLGDEITGTDAYPVTEKVVNGEGYYRCVFTNTYPGSSAIATTISDSFYVSTRYRCKPNPAIYRSVDSIGTITRANPGVIGLNQPNPNLDGQLADLRNIEIGMIQLNNQTVTLTDSGSFLTTGRSYSIGVNTSGYSDFIAGGAFVESISSWDLNGYTVDWKPISGISGTTITTSSAHGFLNGQKVLFTGIVGATELNSKLLTISNAETYTFQVTFSDYISTYVSGGYAIGADTSSSAVSTNFTSIFDLSTNSEEYITITKTALIKFPSILANSAKIFIRAGWTYNGFAFKNSMNEVYPYFGIHNNAPTGQRLSMTLLKNGVGVTELLGVSIPKDPDNGSPQTSSWSETIVNSNYIHTLEGLTNLNEISIEINSIDSAYDRSFESIDDPTDSHSGQINVYDVYVIYDKVSTVTNADSDTIFPNE